MHGHLAVEPIGNLWDSSEIGARSGDSSEVVPRL